MSKNKCRNHLQATGQAYPKSGCEACGGVFSICKYPETMPKQPEFNEVVLGANHDKTVYRQYRMNEKQQWQWLAHEGWLDCAQPWYWSPMPAEHHGQVANKD